MSPNKLNDVESAPSMYRDTSQQDSSARECMLEAQLQEGESQILNTYTTTWTQTDETRIESTSKTEETYPEDNLSRDPEKIILNLVF